MLTVLTRPSSLTLLASAHALPHASAPRNMSNVAPLHGGINILLGGAMMGGMLVVVFCICYCCHKRVHKAECEGEASDQWLQAGDDSDCTLQVFTLDSQQCYEVEGVFVDEYEATPPPTPPPPYHTVADRPKGAWSPADPDLPSYEEAIRLNSHPTFYMDQLTYI